MFALSKMIALSRWFSQAHARAHVVSLSVLLAFLPQSAAAQVRYCGPSDRECTRIAVPLDYSNLIAGQVSLAVERIPAKKALDPPIFVLWGDPSQSATRGFPSAAARTLLGTLLKRRDVIVFDQR